MKKNLDIISVFSFIASLMSFFASCWAYKIAESHRENHKQNNEEITNQAWSDYNQSEASGIVFVHYSFKEEMEEDVDYSIAVLDGDNVLYRGDILRNYHPSKNSGEASFYAYFKNGYNIKLQSRKTK